MVLKFLIRYFMNNEQMVNKLAESYPVRRLAQICVSIFLQGKNNLRSEKLDSESLKKFAAKLKKQLEDSNNQMKK